MKAIEIKVDTKEIEQAIEKANQLVEELQKASDIIDSLKNRNVEMVSVKKENSKKAGFNPKTACLITVISTIICLLVFIGNLYLRCHM